MKWDFVVLRFEVRWTHKHGDMFSEYFETCEEARDFYKAMVENATCANFVKVELIKDFVTVTTWNEDDEEDEEEDE